MKPASTSSTLTLPLFGGATYDPVRDGERLKRQLDHVRAYMLASWPEWRTLAEISRATGFPEASVSARLRDLRKSRNGSYTVEHRRRTAEGGTWEYRVHPKGDE